MTKSKYEDNEEILPYVMDNSDKRVIFPNVLSPLPDNTYVKISANDKYVIARNKWRPEQVVRGSGVISLNLGVYSGDIVTIEPFKLKKSNVTKDAVIYVRPVGFNMVDDQSLNIQAVCPVGMVINDGMLYNIGSSNIVKFEIQTTKKEVIISPGCSVDIVYIPEPVHYFEPPYPDVRAIADKAMKSGLKTLLIYFQSEDISNILREHFWNQGIPVNIFQGIGAPSEPGITINTGLHHIVSEDRANPQSEGGIIKRIEAEKMNNDCKLYIGLADSKLSDNVEELFDWKHNARAMTISDRLKTIMGYSMTYNIENGYKIASALAGQKFKDCFQILSVASTNLMERGENTLRYEDVKQAVHETGKQGVYAQPDVNLFEHYGGFRKIKGLIIRDILTQLENRERAIKDGIKIPNLMLLFGPPGTGKSWLAECLAGTADCHFITKSPNEIKSKWHGESEHNVVKLFNEAQAYAPCIIFIDEIDALVPSRERVQGSNETATASVVNTVLEQLSGINQADSVLLIGATNFVTSLDPAFLSRATIVTYLPPPNQDERIEVFNVRLKLAQRDAKRGGGELMISDDVDIDELSRISDGLVSRDIGQIVDQACRRAFHRSIIDKLERTIVTQEDLLSTTKDQLTSAIDPTKLVEFDLQREKHAKGIITEEDARKVIQEYIRSRRNND